MKPQFAIAASFLALLHVHSLAYSGTIEAGCASPPAPVRDDGQPPGGLAETDWVGIRDAYEAARCAFAATDGGFSARSPRNGWVAHFDAHGFTLAPDAADWSFGLELERFGLAGSEHALDAPLHTCADGQRLTYDWNVDLSEWWINDRRALEHGFTVHRPPVGDSGSCDATLVFELAVRGGLSPSVTTDRRGVRLTDPSNAAVLSYDGLVAFDACGAPLEAWMEAERGRLRIVVRAEGAQYPLTVDPVVHAAYLKASNTEALDDFGISVDISGDTVVVGAPQEDSNATGVDGNQADNSLGNAGAAYVFVRVGGVWSQQAYLKPSNTGANDQFGFSVAIAGDTIVVGARLEDSNATGVNGNEADNSAPNAGATYIFVRTGGTWSQEAYLKASNPDAHDWFGWSVAISGDSVVIGAYQEDSGATGVNGNQADDDAPDSGAAYVFVRAGGTWSQEAYLKASNAEAYDAFGYSIAFSADTVVVGAYGEDSNATGVNGNQANNGQPVSGAAYIFARAGATWSQEAYCKASNTETNAQFGYSVTVDGDTAVVCARLEDEVGSNSGAAYVFERAGAMWSQAAYLKASNPNDHDWFGWSIAIAGDTLVVGALEEDSSATGVNGDQASNGALESGAAYVFLRTGTTWVQQAYLKASNTGAGDWFGYSVAIDGSTVIVCARYEDSNATGVNGDQADNSAANSGAAYVFDLIAPGTIGSNFCHPFHLNSSGMAATITATGSTQQVNDDVVLTVSGLPTAGTTAMLFNSMSASATITGPLSGGVASDGRICIGGGHFGRHFLDIYMGNAGTFALALDLQDMPYPEAPGDYSRIVLVGETWFWQCWYRDGALGPGRNNFSDAVAITFE